MFCPKCGSILVPKKEDTKKVLVCSCGYKTTDTKSAIIRETIRSKVQLIEVVSDKTELETLPKMNVECPKCKHNSAYYWLVQTRAGDEPETRFNKCVKCGNVWRDYG